MKGQGKQNEEIIKNNIGIKYYIWCTLYSIRIASVICSWIFSGCKHGNILFIFIWLNNRNDFDFGYMFGFSLPLRVRRDMRIKKQ